MSGKAEPAKAGQAKKPGAKSDRETRLKSALKANMAKRKTQARKRAASDDTGRA